ncbi:hypothetical protein L6164_004744 [Bauhinia variegata]|uniref:Uncharacterized protein n=1 Tax=Bauhinia variegata TaxID=167791 RepID=A0ACB9PPA9_BAUVA|nr:hypothetical protein L6164_004744 [Bauhinia variegata]
MAKMAVSSQILVMVTLMCCFLSSAKTAEKETSVTYDGRSLIINGKRELLFSGSIHYTRSPPQLWPDILEKAKLGGLDVIQTYVFWNVHERQKDKFTVEERYDIVKFIKLVQEKGMYVTLRVGPFIQAEWNHGGLPYWLREIPDIIFRSDNEPFKKEMQQFVTMVVNKMKEEKLFASQGGPIILAQIENEYNHVQLAYRHKGDSYVQWAAKLAVALNVGVPWIMCKQKDAPDPVINACNGRHCGDTFSGPNKPYKPALWTENWTAQYRSFGDPPSQRAAEDLAFSVARFFSKDGALVNYYMYHGGTNFNRTSSAFSTTRYYDEAPLDEYGLERQPKYGHLRDVHKALSMCNKPLLNGKSSVQKINEFHEIRVYEKAGSELCAAFFANNHTKDYAKITFRGQTYDVPPYSISILPDCKNVVYNTELVVSQHNSRNYRKHKDANNFKWEMYSEAIPTTKELPVSSKFPQELYGLLKDASDYGWYTTTIELGPEDLPLKKGTEPVLRVISLGHAIIVYANGQYVGSKHGAHEDKVCEVSAKANFKVGMNHISVLGITVGLPDSGAYMEHRYAGPKSITILSLNTGTLDLTLNGWGHKVGLKGEDLKIFTEEGSKKVNWAPFKGEGPGLSWYKTTFLAPEGDGPVAIRMTGMGKGMIWVNGENIGRHWMSFLSPLNMPSQSEYHIPRAFLRPKENLLVIFEEEAKGPKEVEILSVDRDTICTFVSEQHPPSVDSWKVKGKKLYPIGTPTTKGTLTCPRGKKIVAVEFASYGDPVGSCGAYDLGHCNAANVKQIVEQECMGKPICSLPVDKNHYLKGSDPCPNIVKTLAVQVLCA